METDDLPTLRRLLGGARCVLLDFDGPVCSLFAGLPAPTIAAELRELIIRDGLPLPPGPAIRDPHQVLTYAATISTPLAGRLNSRLAEREVEAAATAKITPGVAEFVISWHETGRPLAIVSNNSTQAVNSFLARVKLAGAVDHVEGRDPDNPFLMKPNPHLINQAVAKLQVERGLCVLIGDSPSDMAAGKSADVVTVAYVNRPAKRADLVAQRPDALVTRMALLTASIR